MDKKTYEALKRLMGFFNEEGIFPYGKDIEQIETWISEVAKEYEEGDLK